MTDLDALILSLSADTTSRAVEAIAELRKENAWARQTLAQGVYADYRQALERAVNSECALIAADIVQAELRARAEKAEAALVSERKDAERYRVFRSIGLLDDYDTYGGGGADIDNELDRRIAKVAALAKPAIEEQT